MKRRDIGWDTKLSLGASVSLSQNNKVVGRIDGTSFALGFGVDGGLDYLRSVHEWRNSLGVAEMFSRTPAIGAFVKTNDRVALESIYLYHLTAFPWIGPFARLQFETALFQGRDVRPTAVSYVDAVSGAVLAAGATSLRLTDAFLPITLKETVGVFAKPIDRKPVAVEIKAGFLVRQAFAEGQRALADVATTAPIEVAALRNVVQGGPVAGLLASGVLSEGKVTYGAIAELMIPAINNQVEADTRNALDLTNVNLEAKLSFKLVSWASLDCQFRAVREPQMVDAWQLQNNILLTFSYALLEPVAS